MRTCIYYSNDFGLCKFGLHKTFRKGTIPDLSRRVAEHTFSLQVTGCCYGVVSYRTTHASTTTLWYASQSNHSWFIHQNYRLLLQHRNLVAKQGKTGREMTAEFGYQ